MSTDVMLFPHIPSPSSSTSRMTVDLSNQVLTALNHMSVSLSSPDLLTDLPSINANARQPLQPSTITRCHDRVYHACQRFRRHSSGVRNTTFDTLILNDQDKFDHNIADHGYSSRTPVRMIQSAKVSLTAGTADLLGVLPKHLSDVYSKPSTL
jgi:hypothetical protein